MSRGWLSLTSLEGTWCLLLLLLGLEWNDGLVSRFVGT